MHWRTNTLTVTFYIQLLLFIIAGLILYSTRNSNDLSGLESIIFIVPALLLSPILLVSSLYKILKQTASDLSPYVVFVINLFLTAVLLLNVVPRY